LRERPIKKFLRHFEGANAKVGAEGAKYANVKNLFGITAT